LTLDWTAQKALRQARFTRLICAFAAPAMYAGAISMQKLGGHWERFFQSWSRIPWQQPPVPLIATLAVAALAAALLLPSRVRMGSSPLAVARVQNLLTSVLLLGVSVCGLYLGMKCGNACAPLAMVMLAAAPLAGLRQFPTARLWAPALEG